jgi:hypothetical protein
VDKFNNVPILTYDRTSSGGGEMGPRREASQAPRGRGVPGSEGVFDQQEKEQEEQKKG